MPGVYETICKSCGDEGCLISDYLSLRDNGKDICLPHPNECEEIKQYGLTMDEAALAGKLRHNEGYVCRQCGALSYAPSLAVPWQAPTNDKLFYAVMVPLLAVVVMCNLIWGISFCCLLPMTIVIVFAIAVFEDLLIRDRAIKRVRKRVQEEYGFPVDTSCRRCGSTDTVEIDEVLSPEGDAILCDKCGARDRVCTNIGIA